MRELVPRSWLHLQELLFSESWNEDLKRHRSSFAFRGDSDAARRPTTSLARLTSSCTRAGTATELEPSLLRTFKRYAHPTTPFDGSVWCWLALAQHHGLPTRLLDWTFSPYVALHFVTEDTSAFDRDGVVWAVDYVKARDALPAGLASMLREEEAYVFTTDLLARAAPSLRELDALGDDFTVFFEPPSLDARIVNQHALLSLMPGAAASPSDWLDRHHELVKRIIVPRALKTEVRDKLDQANVTERVLYPGLDGLTRWLTRYYAPRS